MKPDNQNAALVNTNAGLAQKLNQDLKQEFIIQLKIKGIQQQTTR